MSFAGRVELIRNVLGGIENLWAQMFYLLKKVIKGVNAICRSFLWTGKGVMAKNAYVSWDWMCALTHCRGLNLVNLELWNIAATIKHL